MWWQKKTTYDSFPEYGFFAANKQPLRATLDNLVFTVLDTETTGFDLGKDKIISVGAIKVVGLAIHIEKSIEFHFPYQATDERAHISVHQMTPKKVGEGLSLKEGYEKLLTFLENSIVVGHNIDFDVSMINYDLKKLFNFTLHNEILDTAQLAIRLERGTTNTPLRQAEYGLDALCSRYNIVASDRHHAAGDALLTATLLIKLLKNAKKKRVNTKQRLIKRNFWL